MDVLAQMTLTGLPGQMPKDAVLDHLESARGVGHALACRLLMVNHVRNAGHLADYVFTSDFARSLWPSIEEGYRTFIRMVSICS
jgi:hypothetical protein